MNILKDDLVKAALLNNLFYSAGYPAVQKILITNVTDKYIAVNAIVLCLATIIFGNTWERYSEILYRKYGIFQILKSVFYFVLLGLLITNSINYKFYYIADTFLMAAITKNILFGSNKLKSLRYTPNQRNDFDNKSLIVSNIASLAGLIISLFWSIPAHTAFILITIGMVIDAAFNYKVYKFHKKIRETSSKIS